MTRIRILSDAVVNRIAAGEVVARPASVVKELVENALDAGAGRIDVELSAGGRSLIRVADDGVGMDPDEALIALERHATSKLESADDLDHIATLGFRGEALPSIAAVSRFRLTTCADPAAGGAVVTVEGGRILGVEGCARGRGTTVEVRDLFFNTPARRKFLHAPETELRHAQDSLIAMALARPEVAVSLAHGGRTLVDAPPAGDLDRRLRDLLRRSQLGSIHRFEAEGGGMRAWGLIARGTGKGRPQLTLLVNGRAVRDRLLVGAVHRVLREAGSGFGGARVALLLTVPPEDVDVNVHPAKAEVRFARSGAVFALVERAVRSAVRATQGTVGVNRVDEAGPALPPPYGAEQPPQTGVRESAPPLFEHPAYAHSQEAPASPPRSVLAPPAAALAQPEGSARASGARPGRPDTPFGRLIGQYRESFLLLEDDYGLVIVDQHVAHERVLYDRILRQLDGEEAPSQGLLEPLLLEFDEVQVSALPRVGHLLGRVGIEADAFGPETVRIRSLPPELGAAAAEEVVRQVLDEATALDGHSERATRAVAEDLAAGLSCRAAVKVNHALADAAQRTLLDDLAKSDNPYRCPHGRPIVLRLGQDEMERRLGRR